MKILRIVCLMAAAIAISFTVTPACADFNWENNITVDTHGLTWGYTEQYTEMNFVLYKNHIDSGVGNDDGYVSAWELLKVDSITRDNFYDSIINDMDVKINDSSTAVHLQEIDSVLSKNALGRVHRRGEATNYYKITYSFDNSLTELGTNIWFLAEPETNMTITFPAGIDVTSTEGIENTKTIVHDGTTTLIGIVGFEGEVNISYSYSYYSYDENATSNVSELESMDNVTSIQDAVEETSVSQLPYDPVDEILKWLGFDPKR